MAVSTYYFDGSDAGATDPDGVWLNDSNAFDGSTGTSASTSGANSSDWGSTSTKYLKAEGTNAPGSGGEITQVRVRLYGSGDEQTGVSYGKAAVYTDGLSELLGTAVNTLGGGPPPGWSDYTTLSAPTGGWTWAKIQALEVKIYNDNYVLNGDFSVFRVEIEVTYSETVSYTSPFPAFRA